MKILHILTAALIVSLFGSGCMTRRSRPDFNVYEGPEIKGTERYEMGVKQIYRSPSGPQESMKIEPAYVSRHYKVEQWRKTWNVVDRKRFVAVAGVHDNYSFGMDIFGDFFAGAFVGGILTPIGILAAPFDDGEMFVTGSSALISILPLISFVGEQYTETVDLDITKKEITPIPKVDSVDSYRLKNKRINWEVYQNNSTRKDHGQITWPQMAELPWCEWVLDNPDVPYFIFKINSDELDLTGVREVRLDVDLKDAVHRQWSNAKDRPSPEVEIKSAEWMDGSGKPISVLRAGGRGNLRVQLKNTSFFSGRVFFIKVQPVVASGPFLEWGDSTTVKWLDSRSSIFVEIPFKVPLETPAEKGKISITGIDTFDRKTETFNMDVTYEQTDLPELSVYSAILRPAEDGGEPDSFLLEVVIRNSGKGSARNVKIAVAHVPDNLKISENSQIITEIAPYSRQTATFVTTAEIPDGISDLPLSISLTEELDIARVNEDVHVAVMTMP